MQTTQSQKATCSSIEATSQNRIISQHIINLNSCSKLRLQSNELPNSHSWELPLSQVHTCEHHKIQYNSVRVPAVHVSHRQVYSEPTMVTSNYSNCCQSDFSSAHLCKPYTIQIYNNNTNAVDELLAYGKMQFGQLLTRINSQYKLRLVNSLQQKINSYLYLEHYDANPKDIYLPMGDRTCIKLRLIRSLPQGLQLICQYGNSQLGFTRQLEEHTFKYDPKIDNINCLLRKWINTKPIQMQTNILIGNIGQNNCFNLKFYDVSEDYNVFMSASVIVNGLLPQNYNILHAIIKDVTKSNNKKVINSKIKIYGPLNQAIFDSKKELEVYVQNHSQLFVQYFQEVDSVEGLQPYCRFQIPINSLNWSKDTYESVFVGKYFDSFKKIQTIITLQLTLKPNNQLSKIMPKIQHPQNRFDQDSPLLLEQLKLNNCFLFEVIKNNEVQFIHVSPSGTVTAFYKFTIKQDKTEYVIETKSMLLKGGKGSLYLINLDQKFTEAQSNKLQDCIIFRINITKPNNLQNQKIDYDYKFLAFAKKLSLVNICKRFNQMVHDDQLKLTVKTKYTSQTKMGILKIVNLKSEGPSGDIQCSIKADSSDYKHRGQIGNYLMKQFYLLKVDAGNIAIKVKLQNVIRSNASIPKQKQHKDKNNINYYGRFCDFFGTPLKDNIYCLQLKISASHKLQIVYSFESYESMRIPQLQQNILAFFNPTSTLHCKLSRAFVPVNNQTYTFRITRAQYIFQTMPYLTSNSKIHFDQTQKLTLPAQSHQESNIVFINAYSHDQQHKLVIYNGFLNIKEILGKGQYQVTMSYQKEGKSKQICLILQIMHSVASQSQGLQLKFNKITINSQVPLFKSIYKHYLLVYINNYQFDIFECSLKQDSFTLNANLTIRKRDRLDLQFYSSIKALSKELFIASQKELIGYGKLQWESIQKNGIVYIDYRPKKQSQIKLNKNSLCLQQKSSWLGLSYASEQLQKEARIEALNIKPNSIDIDVLNRAVVKLNIQEYNPIFISAKISQIQIKPFNLIITSQSSIKINKNFYIKAPNMQFELQAIIILKQQDKYKRIVRKSTINLRGNHYKTNKLNAIKIVFQGLIVLSGNFTIFNNRFVNNPNAQITVKQINLRGSKIVKFYASFIKNIALGDEEQPQFKKQGMQYKIAFSLKTFDQLNGLSINLEAKDYKIKQILCFSQFNIDRQGQQFTYQKQTLLLGESLIISIKLQFNCINPTKKEQSIIQYQIQNLDKTQSIEIKYTNNQYNLVNKNSNKNQSIKKSKGFMIIMSMPELIAQKTKKVQILTDDLQPISLTPSLINNKQYTYYTVKQIKVKNIKIFNSQLIDKPLEYLGSIEGLQKFMIDQNPKLICTVKSFPCLITNLQKQDWIIRIKLHRVFARQSKRLLRLKNTANDQILTKQLGLMIKHGSQMHFIHGLDEFGSLKQSKLCQFQLGYDNSCDILQFYLFIDNFFNQNSILNPSKLVQNWIQFLPVSYGTVNLSNFTQQGYFGCQLKGLVNLSLNLDRSLNELIVRQNNIYFLGDLCFQKKGWGYINLKLLNQTAISFTNKKRSSNQYIYYKLQIQNSSRNILAAHTTQARPLVSAQNILFTSNQLDFFFISQNQQQYSLKITGYLIDSSQHCEFLQKRQDISEFLSRKGKYNINIQIKSVDTNNICQNTYQLTVELNNSIRPSQPQNLIQKAKAINTVDALSFQEFQGTQFFERLLSCQNLSHFYQCLQQIKESFIYNEDPQLQNFKCLIQYLAFDWGSGIIASICQIIHLNLLKAPQIISHLEEQQITKYIYQTFKKICKGQEKQIPNAIKKVETSQFMQTIGRFKKQKSRNILHQAIREQSFILFPPQKFILKPSSKNNQIILNIIMLLIKNSNHITKRLMEDLPEWIQTFGFSPNKNEFQLFILLVKLLLANNQIIQQKNLIRLIDILIEKRYAISMIFELWEKLESKKQRVHIYLSILQKYLQQFRQFYVETCRGIHMMLSQIQDSENSQQHQKFISCHQPVIKQLLLNISKSTDIVLISSHLDLLIYLFELKMINESQKAQIDKLIKEKTLILKQTSSKLILANYSNKISKNKNTKNPNSKKQSKFDEDHSKNRFNRKYLITND